jgi:hypothetical protein
VSVPGGLAVGRRRRHERGAAGPSGRAGPRERVAERPMGPAGPRPAPPGAPRGARDPRAVQTPGRGATPGLAVGRRRRHEHRPDVPGWLRVVVACVWRVRALCATPRVTHRRGQI